MELLHEFILPCAWAFGACMGFCIVFNVHGKGMFLVSLGGGLGWLFYLVLHTVVNNQTVATFVAGVAVSIYAEIMARVRHCPATCYLFIAIVPLVPGLGLYQAMEYYFDGKTVAFDLKIRETLSIAGGIALGVILVLSLMRMVNQRRLGKEKNKQRCRY